LVMDAFLAALALENGATLVTTDRDFSRFPRLRLHDPTAA
jgi:predicted nucleic acid-binding protein